MRYLIPKNIKVKREIFRGYGIIEILIVLISFGFGYLISLLGHHQTLKIVLFATPSILSILLTLPLPNRTTVFTIVQVYIKYVCKQRIYKWIVAKNISLKVLT